MAQARSAWAMKTRKEKIYNLAFLGVEIGDLVFFRGSLGQAKSKVFWGILKILGIFFGTITKSEC